MIDNIATDLVSLLFQEVLDTYHLNQGIIHSYKLSIIWNLGVYFFYCLGHRLFLFPWSWNHQCDPSYMCAPQMLHQRTTLCFKTCLLRGSMVRQWCLVCNSSPLTDYCNNQCQAHSLYFIRMRRLTVCMGALSLTSTIDAPQNGENILRWFKIFWSHLLQYKNGGVRPVFLNSPSFVLVCHR